MVVSRCRPAKEPEHHGVEFSVTCWASQEESGGWRGSALVWHTLRPDADETRHDFEALHATRQAAIDEVWNWAVQAYPAA